MSAGFVSDLHQEGQEADECREGGCSLLFVFLDVAKEGKESDCLWTRRPNAFLCSHKPALFES